MSILQTLQQLAYAVHFGYAPKNGSKCLSVLCDFAAQSPFLMDLETPDLLNSLEFIQACFIDNSANSSPFTLTLSAPSGQKVVCPPFSQGYFPLACNSLPKFVATVTSGTPVVPVQFYNVPYPAAIWSSNSASVISGGGLGSDFSANPPALLANLIATVPVNAARANIEVQNQAAVPIQIALDDGTGAYQTIIVLTNGTGAGTQGGGWNSQTFKGRARIFATNTTDKVSVHQD